MNTPIITGDSKVDGTGTLQPTTPVIVHLNKQLPPDLEQQRVDPLALPGFALPTGQNGLFRLSSQAAAADALPATSAPQNWSMGNASISLAQPEQSVPDTQAGIIELGAVGQIAGATRQLVQSTWQRAGISASASDFNTAAPVSDVAIGLPVNPGTSPNTGGPRGLLLYRSVRWPTPLRNSCPPFRRCPAALSPPDPRNT